MYLCIYDSLKEVKITMNSNPTPFKKRENPLAKVTKASVSTERIKYTATMDPDLRKRLKVAAAMKDVQISTLIEEAIVEKLEREGY